MILVYVCALVRGNDAGTCRPGFDENTNSLYCSAGQQQRGHTVICTLEYLSVGPEPRPAAIKHKTYPFGTVYSGTTFGRSSTIRNAALIVAQLCELEGLDPNAQPFFDLQTCNGYLRKRPGEFEFDQVAIRVNSVDAATASFGRMTQTITGVPLRVSSWQAANCPSEVLKDFAVFVNVPPLVK